MKRHYIVSKPSQTYKKKKNLGEEPEKKSIKLWYRFKCLSAIELIDDENIFSNTCTCPHGYYQSKTWWWWNDEYYVHTLHIYLHFSTHDMSISKCEFNSMYVYNT